MPHNNAPPPRRRQAIDASIATPYWDFLLDSAVHGSAVLANSEIFSNDYFGAASYRQSNDYVVADGPFAYLEQARRTRQLLIVVKRPDPYVPHHH